MLIRKGKSSFHFFAILRTSLLPSHNFFLSHNETLFLNLFYVSQIIWLLSGGQSSLKTNYKRPISQQPRTYSMDQEKQYLSKNKLILCKLAISTLQLFTICVYFNQLCFKLSQFYLACACIR